MSVALRPLKATTANGFGAMVPSGVDVALRHDATTEEYAQDQREQNTSKTQQYLIPVLERTGAKTVLDVGCGVGTMVCDLLQAGYNAYGIDLLGLEKFWTRLDNPRDRFFVVDPYAFELPFEDKSLDLAFSFGVIEHVGTSNGHSDRLANYHEMRKQWLREIFRAIKVGGYMLMGGPNRNFPIDVAHGPDSKATPLELTLTRWAKATVHWPWGENFLWSYSDIPRYLEGLSYSFEGLSVKGLVAFGRVPAVVRPLVKLYVHAMPKFLLSTPFNPWMMALIQRTG